MTINEIDLNKFLVLLLLFMPFSATTQTIKLDYIPHGLILKFNFKNLTLYTDTSSLFSIENNPSHILDKTYEQRIRNLINMNSENDTAIFIGSFIPFNDSVQNPYETDWRVWLSLRQLTWENKIKIIDSHGVNVKKIKIKKKGSDKRMWTGKVFINSETKEELFVYKDIHISSGLLWDY